MQQYLCECQICQAQKNCRFYNEPYPAFGSTFNALCESCHRTTPHQRVLTRKTQSELNRIQAEKDLQQLILDKCAEYGFVCKFVYQSVVITTPLADWSFDYHQSKKTLYHESTVKINFETGNYSKTHCQFRDRKMKPVEVIEYIAEHEAWRMRSTTQT